MRAWLRARSLPKAETQCVEHAKRERGRRTRSAGASETARVDETESFSQKTTERDASQRANEERDGTARSENATRVDEVQLASLLSDPACTFLQKRVCKIEFRVSANDDRRSSFIE